VLPVFFGNRDACLVDEPGFEVMKELNPQVGRGVQVFKASELLADALICLRGSTWSSEQFKGDLIKILGELHAEPVGQQILTLFKVSQLLPFEEKQLDTVRKLRVTYERLCTQGVKSADIGSTSKPPM
jgi:phosphonate transport system substrate-binding protein